MTELEAEYSLLEAWIKDTGKEILKLMHSEDPAKGIVFPKEIFELTQQKNMLGAMRDLRKARMNRIRFMNGE